MSAWTNTPPNKMNPDLELLQAYPFEKLNRLKASVTANSDYSPIALSVGEPKHPAPDFVLETLARELRKVENYPSTKGLPELRQTIADWCTKRFQLQNLDSETQVLPVNGTREALFAFVQAAIEREPGARVVCPNPFYQIYEGATLLAGARPYFIACHGEQDYLPDFDSVEPAVWRDCQVLFLCSPGNPTGTVIPVERLKSLIEMADKYDFIIAADECYSEIYFEEDSPPTGLLQACADLGRHDYSRCVVFHSLSKRSNLPGLRSGFVAGDGNILQKFLLYRTYHGCAMPMHNQMASIAAWGDETHVIANRDQYREKFDAVLDVLQPVMQVEKPDAGFYLWPQLDVDDVGFAQQLYQQKNVIVLPGSYLGREVDGVNPGACHVRMALVAPLQECIDAATRIRDFVETFHA